MAKRTGQLILALGMGTIALLATLVLLVNPATAADQCVHPTGAGSCLSSIQAAIDAAIGGDTIRVVQGTYNENVAITKDIVLEGGYQDENLVTRDPDLYLTTINGGGVGVVISITNSADVTVDGFTITGGDGSNNVYPSGPNLDSGGGGIFIREATALISNNVISGNVGSRIANTSGLGGGILVISSTSPVRINGNVIQANVAQLANLASSVPISAGVGGGIAIGNSSSAIIAGNQVASNVALQANIPPQDTWSGAGGIAWWGDEITLDSNNVRYNVGNEAGGDGTGGGIGLWGNEATLTNNTVAHNTAAVSGANAEGGGISAGGVQTLTLNGNTIISNVAAESVAVSGSGGAGGGGINLWQTTALLQSNVISGNTSNLDGDGWGGGLFANESVLTMDANFILGNRMNPSYDGGSGGVWAWRTALTSTNDVFARNYDAIGGGGDTADSTLILINATLYDNGRTGVRVNDSSTAYVTNTIVYSHDNGLEKDTGATLIEDYNLLNNTTNYGGGISPGSHTILDQDPLFVNAAADDFHLSSDSPAIDKGTSVGAPSVDFEGDPRPMVAGFDIGADEFSPVFLPIILKNATS